MKKRIQIKAVRTRRNYDWSPLWHLVYEWEDIFADCLAVPLRGSGFAERYILRYFLRGLERLGWSKYHDRISRLMYLLCAASHIDRVYSKLLSFLFNDGESLCFEMFPRSFYSLKPMRNRIVYIIDFDFTVDLEKFNYNYRNCPLVLISSREAFNFLKRKGCSLNIEHLALSISDKYHINKEAVVEKKYDVLIGKQNEFLQTCFLRFIEKYPDVHYVTFGKQGKHWEYTSNRNGLIGDFLDRSHFMELLSKSKITFYSTRGIDMKETIYLNHVTPRLFEYIYNRCFVLGRYPANEEVEEFNIQEVCPQVNNYEDFETLMLHYLNTDVTESLDKYQEFLRKNYTSVRATRLREILANQRK